MNLGSLLRNLRSLALCALFFLLSIPAFFLSSPASNVVQGYGLVGNIAHKQVSVPICSIRSLNASADSNAVWKICAEDMQYAAAGCIPCLARESSLSSEYVTPGLASMHCYSCERSNTMSRPAHMGCRCQSVHHVQELFSEGDDTVFLSRSSVGAM